MIGKAERRLLIEGELSVGNATPWRAPTVKYDHVDVPVVCQQLGEVVFYELYLRGGDVEVPNVITLAA